MCVWSGPGLEKGRRATSRPFCSFYSKKSKGVRGHAPSNRRNHRRLRTDQRLQPYIRTLQTRNRLIVCVRVDIAVTGVLGSETLTNFKERRSARKKGLCFVCLKPHLARNCRSELKCPECNGHHHRLLCINNRRPTENGSPNGDQNEPQNKPESPVNLHANLARKPGKQTMLQIAQVRFKGNGPEVKANLLFDSG